MSELRYNIINREWVVIATERAKRPHDFVKPQKYVLPIPGFRQDCPFCPGNEGDLSDETFRIGDKEKWKMRSIYNGLNNPDFNYTIRSMPVEENGKAYFHWYLSIVPRITLPAGFELGSGIFINSSLPEESAEFLRNTRIP